MSLHVLHAGAGYRYLLRTTAAGDGTTPTDGLAAYYAASGTPPGVWVGGGLAGLNDGHGLPSGLPVDETTLGRLFGHGHDPVTGLPLGRGLATRRLPDGGSAVVGVAGFDLTFTVPKSASVLWALGDPDIQAEVLAAHHATIDVVLGWAEREIVVTRTGHAGATPLPRPHRRHCPPRPHPRHHPRSPLRRTHPGTGVQRRLDHHHPHHR